MQRDKAYSSGQLTLALQKHPAPRLNRDAGRKLRVAGLFAGIGGIELGLHRAGHSTALLCEIDPAACAVLRRRFPGIALHEDIRTLKRVGTDIDLLAAGFPCQDLSQAGRTRGIDGHQSGLVSHVFDLLRMKQIPWLLLENVPFMLQLGKGRALEFIIGALESLGYKWAYRVIDSRAFGLPQRRERVYLVASSDADPRSVLFVGDHEPPGKNGAKDVACGFYWTEGIRGLGWAVDAIPTLKGGSTVGIPSQPAIVMPSGDVVKPDIRDAERLQGFPTNWTKPAESVARAGARWKLVGNAVTVQVAEWLGKQFTRLAGNTTPEGRQLKAGDKWPRAAWNVGNGRFEAFLSSWPVQRKSPHLAEFLRFQTTPLSAKATAGFLARTRVSSLRFPEGFISTLERHLERVSTGQ